MTPRGAYIGRVHAVGVAQLVLHRTDSQQERKIESEREGGREREQAREREREREGERESARGRERERAREGVRESKREREGERDLGDPTRSICVYKPLAWRNLCCTTERESEREQARQSEREGEREGKSWREREPERGRERERERERERRRPGGPHTEHIGSVKAVGVAQLVLQYPFHQQIHSRI